MNKPLLNVEGGKWYIHCQIKSVLTKKILMRDKMASWHGEAFCITDPFPSQRADNATLWYILGSKHEQAPEQTLYSSVIWYVTRRMSRHCNEMLFQRVYCLYENLPSSGTAEAVGGAASTRISSRSNKLPNMVRPDKMKRLRFAIDLEHPMTNSLTGD